MRLQRMSFIDRPETDQGAPVPVFPAVDQAPAPGREFRRLALPGRSGDNTGGGPRCQGRGPSLSCRSQLSPRPMYPSFGDGET